MRLVKESLTQDDTVVDVHDVDVESLMSEADDDKTYAAMGVAKTIGSVSSFFVRSMVISC